MQSTCKSMRTSIYKKEILKVLSKHHVLSIADIHRAIPDADYSTIYRNIEKLLEEKEIKKVLIDQKTSLYEIVDDHAHDHFVCDDCGDVAEISIPREGLGVKLPVSDITVRGQCGDCVEK